MKLPNFCVIVLVLESNRPGFDPDSSVFLLWCLEKLPAISTFQFLVCETGVTSLDDTRNWWFHRGGAQAQSEVCPSICAGIFESRNCALFQHSSRYVGDMKEIHYKWNTAERGCDTSLHLGHLHLILECWFELHLLHFSLHVFVMFPVA